MGKAIFVLNYAEIYLTERAHVKKIKKQMKKIFGIDEDPFESYRETNSYSLKMTI